MTAKDSIYKLLYKAFIEIREEALEAELSKTYHLADLLHNIPLRLKQASEADDYDELMKQIRKRASEKGIDAWVENYTED